MKKIVKITYVLDENDKKAIKKQMVDLGLTLRTMSAKLGVSTSYLCEILNGKRNVTKRVREQFESQGIILEGENE